MYHRKAMDKMKGRPPGPQMPCGWGCGELLSTGNVREHFASCPKRNQATVWMVEVRSRAGGDWEVLGHRPSRKLARYLAQTGRAGGFQTRIVGRKPHLALVSGQE
jgi:hypothetical protein